MIILACDHCRRQSPDEHGVRVADDWVTVSFQVQRDRERRGDEPTSGSVRLILCRDCLPKLGREVRMPI